MSFKLRLIYSTQIDYLTSLTVPNAKESVQYIIAHVLQLSPMDVYLHFDHEVDLQTFEKISNLVQKRGLGTPLDYILGKKTFLNCEIDLTCDVLIPRVETEILADMVVREILSFFTKKKSPNNSSFTSHTPKKLLDLCTGSGCLAISIKKKIPHLLVTGVDICSKALTLAKSNAKKNGVDISFMQSDLLENVKEKFDFVVCNPPYISQKEYENLDKSVKNFEPQKALLAGSSGLEFYERLEKELPRVLNPHAKIFFEIGYNQKNDLDALFSKPIWKQKRFIQDFSGHDRFFFLEIE